MTILIAIVLLVLALIVGFGLYRTIVTRLSPNQALFVQGKAPDPLPDGLYKGSVPGYEFTWKGKKFHRADATGINIFRNGNVDEERYPFHMYIAKGVQDTATDVLKIDYNISGNPLWLRIILDEITEVGSGKYLGKVHVRVIPGIPFTMGYFWLER